MGDERTPKGASEHTRAANAAVRDALPFADRSDFERALESVHAIFGRQAIPIQLPLGSERDFKGAIDLIRMKAYTYTPDGDGKGKESEIPASMADAAQKAHEALVEMVAEGKDDLMEEFFEQGTLPVEHIVEGLRRSARNAL